MNETDEAHTPFTVNDDDIAAAERELKRKAIQSAQRRRALASLPPVDRQLAAAITMAIARTEMTTGIKKTKQHVVEEALKDWLDRRPANSTKEQDPSTSK